MRPSDSESLLILRYIRKIKPKKYMNKATEFTEENNK